MPKTYSDPELGQMPDVKDTGLNEAAAANKVMKKVSSRVGSKRVARKTAPKAGPATRLVRAIAPIKAPAQGNSASTTPGINSDAMMAAAKKLLGKK